MTQVSFKGNIFSSMGRSNGQQATMIAELMRARAQIIGGMSSYVKSPPMDMCRIVTKRMQPMNILLTEVLAKFSMT
jgi:hypothetical protein